MLEAQSHIRKVSIEGSCRLPREKVIPLKRLYPNLTSNYSPMCVILHRCADDTGCCADDSMTCEAKETEIIERRFAVSTIYSK